MKAGEICSKVMRKLVCLTIAVWLTQAAFAGTSIEDTFDVLKTRTGTYTNVTVTTRETSYIFIVHANGMSSIKVHDLTLEDQRKLGYAVEPPPDATTNAAAMLAEPSEDEPQATEGKGALGVLAGMLFLILAGVVLGHLFFSYCSLLICRKTNTPAGALIWLPVVQGIPLLQAAGMPGWQALIWPLVFIPWSFKIAKACQKGTLTAILLILPPTSVMAFMYLAFSSSKPPPLPQKFKAEPLAPPLPDEAHPRPQSA